MARRRGPRPVRHRIGGGDGRIDRSHRSVMPEPVACSDPRCRPVASAMPPCNMPCHPARSVEERQCQISTIAVSGVRNPTGNMQPLLADASTQWFCKRLTVLSLAARSREMTQADSSRHVLAPAVESTETWCVAAFSSRPSDLERLSGQELVNEFMCALERSESRNPKASYVNVDKSPHRRSSCCEKHAPQSDRIIAGCPRFQEAHDQLRSLALSIAVNGHD